MLTKSLLQFKRRKNRLYPQLIEVNDDTNLNCAQELISLYKSAVGETLIATEKKALTSYHAKSKHFKGLVKLLEDRCTEESSEDTNNIETQRWQWILSAQQLRQSVLSQQLSEFQENFSFEQQENYTDIRSKIYSDLPESKTIQGFKDISPMDLLHRYNCAQFQGLLLQAKDISIDIEYPTPSCLRPLFQQLKFHRLLCHMTHYDKRSCSFSLNGPLSITNQRQSYGIRIANFFPHLLNQSHWKLSAVITQKGRDDELLASQKLGLKSHYPKKESYIPKELTLFVDDFNKRSSTWQAAIGQDFLHIGEQSYCFPDVVFSSSTATTRYLELFHSWHYHQLHHRVKTLAKTNDSSLIIGACKRLLKKKTMDISLQQSKWFSKNGFLFCDFPTTTKVMKLLSDNP